MHSENSYKRNTDDVRHDAEIRAGYNFGRALSAFLIVAACWILFIFVVSVIRILFDYTWQDAINMGAIPGLLAFGLTCVTSPYIGFRLTRGVCWWRRARKNLDAVE